MLLPALRPPLRIKRFRGALPLVLFRFRALAVKQKRKLSPGRVPVSRGSFATLPCSSSLPPLPPGAEHKRASERGVNPTLCLSLFSPPGRHQRDLACAGISTGFSFAVWLFSSPLLRFLSRERETADSYKKKRATTLSQLRARLESTHPLLNTMAAEPFLHFGQLISHQSSCYYNQDLH